MKIPLRYRYQGRRLTYSIVSLAPFFLPAFFWIGHFRFGFFFPEALKPEGSRNVAPRLTQRFLKQSTLYALTFNFGHFWAVKFNLKRVHSNFFIKTYKYIVFFKNKVIINKNKVDFTTIYHKHIKPNLASSYESWCQLATALLLKG